MQMQNALVNFFSFSETADRGSFTEYSSMRHNVIDDYDRDVPDSLMKCKTFWLVMWQLVLYRWCLE
jgi:hypothetical protein